MRYIIAYTDKNAIRRVITKGYSSRRYFNTIEEAEEYATKIDRKQFKVEILTSKYEFVKEI